MSVQISSGPCDVPECPSLTFPYKTDHFQNHSFQAIESGKHVLVTAHTGSGKTTVAEYSVAYGLKLGKKVIYTAPLKALTNQIYGDFRRKYPAWDIGIKTGDIDYRSDEAQVVIMVTEVLRNRLYRSGLDDVGVVIFDEVHYIREKERGAVWEESIVMMPSHIQMIMLSATLPDSVRFAGWIAKTKGRDVAYATTNHRVVPLTHYVQAGEKRYVIMDHESKFHADNYQRALSEYSFAPSQLNQYIKYIKLPALFFCFSKNMCQEYAGRITLPLVTPEESIHIEREFDRLVRRFSNETLAAEAQTVLLRSLASKGVCFHHAGLIPALKEVVQELFSHGLLQVMFVTETFAAGVNFPAKTVVFTGFSKFDDRAAGHFRVLYTEEYLQMAGRAGRRGIDTVGDVIHLPFSPRDILSLSEAKAMMTGQIRPIVSQFQIDFSFFLRSVLARKDILCNVEGSLYSLQAQERRSYCCTELQNKEQERDRKMGALKDTEILRLAREGLRSQTKKERAKYVRECDGLSKGDALMLEQYTRALKEVVAIEAVILDLETRVQDIDDLLVQELQNLTVFLRGKGYLSVLKPANLYTPEDVTTQGIMCAEFNECNGVVMTQLMSSGVFDDCTTEELISLLSMFTDARSTDREKNIPHRLKQKIHKMQEIADGLEAEAQGLGSKMDWSCTDELCDVSLAWLREGSMGAVYEATRCELHEGELVRLLLKLNNLCKEVREVSKLAQMDAITKILEGHQELLIHGIVTPESMHVSK